MPDPITTMNISVPKSMRAFIKDRMDQGGFANTSEYIRHLVRQDQERIARRLGELIQAGLDSGPPIEVTPQFWADMRRRVRDRVAELRRSSRKAAG